MKQVTAYIPCHNAEATLARCLEGLRAQSVKPLEILVVNDGSTDRTGAIADGYAARVIDLPRHPGLAGARNAAIEAARNEYIASLDADCVADPTWLERLLDAMRGDGVAGVGGRLTETYRRSLADQWRAAHMRQDWGAERIENPPFLFGCNTLFRKRALEDLGGYDLRFRTNGEDVDISHRLKEKGHTLIYQPAAVVRHLKRDTPLSVLRADWKWGYVSLAETTKFESRSRIVYHNFANAKYRFLADLSSRRYRLLPLDLLLLFYHTYLDLAHAKGLMLPKATARGFGSRLETLTAFHRYLTDLSDSHFLRNPDGTSVKQGPGRGRS